VRVLGANAGGLRKDPKVAIRPVIGQLSPPGEAIGGARKDSHENIGETHPPRESDTHVAVVGEDPIPSTIEGKGRSDLNGFVTRRADHEGRTSLPIERKHAIVDPSRFQHEPVHLEHLGVG
jgi:hypothetical protein